MREKIREINTIIDEIVMVLRQGYTTEGIKKINNIMPELNSIIMKFIESIPEYHEKGIDIPQDVIITQLQNMLEGIEYQDCVQLADTLEYELADTLKVYDEILTELGE